MAGSPGCPNRLVSPRTRSCRRIASSSRCAVWATDRPGGQQNRSTSRTVFAPLSAMMRISIFLHMTARAAMLASPVHGVSTAPFASRPVIVEDRVSGTSPNVAPDRCTVTSVARCGTCRSRSARSAPSGRSMRNDLTTNRSGNHDRTRRPPTRLRPASRRKSCTCTVLLPVGKNHHGLMTAPATIFC